MGRLLRAGEPAQAGADSRRIAVAFVALIALTTVILNVGVYESVRTHDARNRLERFQGFAKTRTGQVRDVLVAFQREAQGVAQTLTPGPVPAMEASLDRAARSLSWRTAVLLDPTGIPLAGAMPRGLSTPPSDVVAHVFQTRAPALVRMEGDARGENWLVAIVPTVTSDLALAAWSPLEKRVGSALMPSGSPAEVRSHLTPPGAGTVWDPTATSDREPAHMVVRDGTREIWVDRRWIPELGVNLVTTASRDALGSANDPGITSLVVFDVAILLLVLASVFFWRRQYEVGLAQRELEVTVRHAHRTQAVFDSAFDAILTVGADGRISSANRAAESILDRTGSDLVGTPFASRFRLEDRDLETVDALSGRVSRGAVLRGDGSMSPVELSVAATGVGLDRIYTVVARDISRQIAAEQQIRESAQGLEISNRRLAELNAQLEEGSRLKSEFLANTSHELRTPLNGMIGLLQLVLDGMCSSPEEEREYQRQALNCSRHLLGLINDVLDLAKIEAGKLTLELESVDPQKLLAEVYAVTHIQAVPKHLALKFESAEAPSTTVRADFRKAKQVIINLVGNAIKFTPSGGVTVRASEHAQLGYWMFEVIDTGIGIPRDRQSQVFEKFIQADGSTTRTYGGTGLGLAICRSLVELMGGVIGLESEGEGLGTRTYFTLPVWRSEAVTPETEPHTEEQIAGPAGGPLVLIVEDDPVFRRLVSTLLHRQGYRTVEARHAEAAWVLARRLRPAIVVLDYALTCAEGASLRTGWDLAERMTQDERTRHIPLIFVTGFEDEVVRRLKRNTFSKGLEHLGKPIDAPTLLGRIDSLLGSIHDRPVRILMADDDPSVAAYVRKILPETRFHLEVANNGDECLHILRVQPRGYDLLLLDLMMPGVSGYDVLRELTLSGDYRDLPVLILTNFPEARTAEERRLLEHGEVLDVLPKTSVHDHPMILPHIIDWHLQVRRGRTPRTDGDAARSGSETNWKEAA